MSMKPQRFAELTRRLDEIMADIVREASPPLALALVDGVISRVQWAGVAGAETETVADASRNRGSVRMTVSLVIVRRA